MQQTLKVGTAKVQTLLPSLLPAFVGWGHGLGLS